ncbi:MAG: ribonuclease HI [Cryobacterium sp.]|nr:ribonuclease HI [Oligoflexia bacterium]
MKNDSKTENTLVNGHEHNLVIFTDGACSGNPGPGGWGAVLAHPEGKIIELGGSSRATTNNQMELLATIEGLEAARDFQGQVSVYTDSTYVIRGITQWVWGWRKRDWKTAQGKEVANQDLWKNLVRVVSARKLKPEWHYVRGHIGTPGNERCDEIAREFTSGRRPPLYRGSLKEYAIAIHDVPADTGLPEMRPKEEKKVAHSYLSVVNGALERHSDWKSCEARVKGRPGAKFKKAASPGNEIEILREWGFAKKDASE